MNILLTIFIVLFVLFGFLPVPTNGRQAGRLIEIIYAASLDKTDVDLSSEKISAIHDFKEQTKEAIGKAKILIRNKQLNIAKRKLEEVLILVREKISIYEDKAKTLISEEKKDNAKVYSQEASSLSKITVQISKSLNEIRSLEVDSKIKQSKESLDKADFAQAKILLEEALNILPENERNRRRQVKSLLVSISRLREKSENKKRNEESAYHTTQGFEYLESGRLDEAQTSFKKALDIVSNNRKAKNGLARVDSTRRRMYARRISTLLKESRENIRAEAFNEAEKKLQEVLTLEPGNRKAQNYLAEIEELRQAKASKDLLVNIDQKVEKGKTNLSIGRFEEAETSFKEALKLLPPDDKTRRKKIESLLISIPELKQKYQARGNYEKIEKIVANARDRVEQNKLEELIKEGRDYLIDNNFEEAKRKFLEVLKIRPKNELALQYLAETKQAKKNYESREAIERLIAKGKKYLEAEQLDKADATLRRTLKMSPSEDKQIEIQALLSDIDKAKQTIYNRKLQQQADKYIANGVENLKKNQYTKAGANFEKALAIKSDYAEAKEWLIRLEKIQEEAKHQKIQAMIDEGKVCLEGNKFDTAREKFAQALKTDPTYTEALYYLDMTGKTEAEYKDKQRFEKVKAIVDKGMKYLEEGQFDKAESTFKEAVEMTPLDIRGQTVKIIEEKVGSLIDANESSKRADKYISDGIVYLNNNEFDKAEEAFKIAFNIIPEYPRGKEYLQRLEIAKLKCQNIQSLEQIGSAIGESEKLQKANLEYLINQLVEQIKSKIEDSEKVLKKREN